MMGTEIFDTIKGNQVWTANCVRDLSNFSAADQAILLAGGEVADPLYPGDFLAIHKEEDPEDDFSDLLP